MALKAGDNLGQYTIVEETGRGGMAVVYRAHQPSLRRDVAIKVLPDFFADSQDFRERFVREAAAAAQLRHPNIVVVFDYGEEAGSAYIVMEFVSGGTLVSRLGSPILPADALAMLQPIASALDYAHERGVVHRDVKPSNILISDEGRLVLTDFGLARLEGSMPPLTRTGTPLGTALYMAPEMATGGVATSAADEYSLAVVAYEMLTGKTPFSGAARLGVLMAHLKPIPLPSRETPGIPAAVDAVLERALEVLAQDRFPTATAFVEALAEASRDGYVSAASAADDVKPVLHAPADGPSLSPVSARQFRYSTEFPTEDDAGVRASGVRRQAIAEAVQYPEILIGLAVAAIALTYRLVLASVFGEATLSLAVLAVALVAAVGALFIRYPQARAVAYRQRQRQHDAERGDRREAELGRLQAELRQDCATLQARECLKALDRLSEAYADVKTAVGRRRPNEPMVMVDTPEMARGGYGMGLRFIRAALELEREVRAAGVDHLLNEIEALTAEIAELRADPQQAERLRLREASLRLHKEALARAESARLERDKVLLEAQRCENALRQFRIELSKIHSGTSDLKADAIVEGYRRTMEQARAVLEEYRRLGLI